MKLTEPKRRVLLAAYRTRGESRDAQDRAGFRADRNSVVTLSLMNHGLMKPPGVLTDDGLKLAREIAQTKEGKP